MNSITTNVSAMAALQTLRATNQSMDETQNRISTGYRVAEAKDNAAYWSIATTMRSDILAQSAVYDALGLGAATLDTAYNGLEAAKDALNAIKGKVITAKQDGIDRSKVQADINQLVQQLRTISDSSTFSSQNLLVTEDDRILSPIEIPASLQRIAGGSLQLDTIKIDPNPFPLFTTGATSAAIVDFGKGGNDVLTGGIVSEPGYNGYEATRARLSMDNFPGPLVLDDDDEIVLTIRTIDSYFGDQQYDVIVNKLSVQASLGRSDGVIVGSGAFAVVLGEQANTAGFSGVGGYVSIYSVMYGSSSSIEVVGISANPNTGGGNISSGGLVLDGPISGTDATPGGAVMAPFEPLTIDRNDTIMFSISADNGPEQSIRIDYSTVVSALGAGTNGHIGSLSDMVAVINEALGPSAGATATVGTYAATGSVVFVSNSTGPNSIVTIGEAVANAGRNVAEMDLTRPGTTDEIIDEYIQVVETAMQKVIAAAAKAGSARNRIDLQMEFTSKLTDTVAKGVGILVDADITEEATRLKALQTQQQLGVQSLSIANSSSQTLLSLFQ